MAAYRFWTMKGSLGRRDDCTLASQPVSAWLQHGVVLCIQDTTELDYNGQQMEGLGPLSYEAQRGMYLHLTYVVTPEREPLESSTPGCGRGSSGRR